mmetsp:Transcript_32102/g.65382  ORF Transcript_32102/g.65382 Transcript_32102/m.65382 type:complete len:217 (+) Transcript_32102:522-1172(+)
MITTMMVVIMAVLIFHPFSPPSSLLSLSSLSLSASFFRKGCGEEHPLHLGGDGEELKGKRQHDRNAVQNTHGRGGEHRISEGKGDDHGHVRTVREIRQRRIREVCNCDHRDDLGVHVEEERPVFWVYRVGDGDGDRRRALEREDGGAEVQVRRLIRNARPQHPLRWPPLHQQNRARCQDAEQRKAHKTVCNRIEVAQRREVAHQAQRDLHAAHDRH